MAKDRTPGNRATGGPVRGGSTAAGKSGGRGRMRPPTQVVTQNRRPWGLIAAALAVLVFAVAAIGYALVQVNRQEAAEITSPDEIEGVQSYEYEAGTHTAEPVDYTESPPVGGPHAGIPEWADCTGVVYDVDIRHENAVHSLEHGAVWITYDPDAVSDADIETLSELVDGESGRMLSPYVGLDSPISVQSWNHQLKVDSVDDERIEQFADFMTYNRSPYGDDTEKNEALAFPEPGASCENPAFAAEPLTEGDPSTPVGPSDMPSTEEQG